MATVDDLTGVPLFASLDDTELGVLAQSFERRSVGAGTRLIGEGASGYSFFVLKDGAAAVTQGEATVAELGPGDFFGEIAILGDGRRTATVTTTTQSDVLAMFGTEFRRLEAAQPAIATSIVEAMRARVAR